MCCSLSLSKDILAVKGLKGGAYHHHHRFLFEKTIKYKNLIISKLFQFTLFKDDYGFLNLQALEDQKKTMLSDCSMTF